MDIEIKTFGQYIGLLNGFGKGGNINSLYLSAHKQGVRNCSNKPNVAISVKVPIVPSVVVPIKIVNKSDAIIDNGLSAVKNFIRGCSNNLSAIVPIKTWLFQ